ncbi:transglutaminase domain-containing protein [uncultured Flavobacterium sp.]|uniref:transglutaminase domain-containing protein n=1 Tax=uncultured Flavobacterium sp. TaxID=165435 RepID=UPI0025ECD164|nr:transglutaminase domain-containing protein [uncultured Flavobacterium sp.]
MKKIHHLFSIFLLLISGIMAAQDFAKVDATVKSWPDFSDTDKFAAKVNADFKREDERARAIFTWIATHVKYDLAAYGVNERPVAYSFKTQAEKEAKEKKFKEDLATKTLKSKKGVCQGYATLFYIVAGKAGLESVIITGTSKSHPAHIGAAPGASDHAWNAVKIAGEWKLLDATWAAGTVTGEKPQFGFRFNDKYFFTDPDIFFLNHFPDDKKWLFTAKTEKDFAELPLYYGNYLMGGYEFVTPDGGTFTNQPSAYIPFKVKNLQPADKVHYAFSREKIFKDAKPVTTGSVSEFSVPLDRNSNGVLTIYINQKSVAAYRIR